MSRITDGLHDNLSPQMAIIVYQTEHNQFYLERRDIGKGHQMGAGTPLSEDCLSSLITEMSDTEHHIVSGMIPPCMLYSDSRAGQDKYVWHRKEEKRTLLFAPSLHIPNGEMHIPSLIYVVEKENLMVYAYKGKLTPETTLYRAPFFNVGTYHVCLGNAKIPKPEERTFHSIIEYWEKMFWVSEFSQLLDGSPVKGDLVSITKTCIQEKTKFPAKVLTPLNLTLENILI